MQLHRHARSTRAPQERRRKIGATVLSIGLVGFGLAVTTTTISPASAAITSPGDGQLIRDEGPIAISEDRGGRYATLGAATS